MSGARAGGEDRGARIVIGPDVFGRSLFEEPARQVLELWRDGRLTPVIDSQLLRQTLSLIRRLGVASPDSLRRWAWWLSSEDRVEFVRDATGEWSGANVSAPGGLKGCIALAERAGVALVITEAGGDSSGPETRGIELVSSERYLSRVRA